MPGQTEDAGDAGDKIWRLFGGVQGPINFPRFGAFGPSSIPQEKIPDRIRVRKPDGTVGTVSNKNLAEAKKAGFTVIE